jgi:hypothetical protein
MAGIVEESVHQAFVPIRCGIGEESGAFGFGGRKTDEIEIETPDQQGAWCLGLRGEFAGFAGVLQEGVDGIAQAGRVWV